MSDNVVEIRPSLRRMVATMEDILGRIRRGEIESVTIAAVSHADNVISGTTTDNPGGNVKLFTLVGALEAEKARLLVHGDESIEREIERIAEDAQ